MARYRRLRPPEFQIKRDSKPRVTVGVLLVCLFWWLFVVILVLIASAPHFSKLRSIGWEKAFVLGGKGHEIGLGSSLDAEMDSGTVDLSVPNGSSGGSLASTNAPSKEQSKPSRIIPVIKEPALLESVNFKIEPLLDRRAPSLEENAHRIMKQLVRKWTLDLINEAEVTIEVIGQEATKPAELSKVAVFDVSKGNQVANCSSSHEVTSNQTSSTSCGTQRAFAHHPSDLSGLPYVGLPICPPVPEHLVHQRIVSFNASFSEERAELNARLESTGVSKGGEWKPISCIARHKLIVVIPYRDRASHLISLLKELHALLQSQDLHYKIVVAEQKDEELFNKGMLMNAGFMTAVSSGWWDCVVFHDVDLIPEDGRNMYTCPPRPRHLSVAVDKLNYTLPYYYLMGGVVAFRTEHFLKVNGYSNLYWGWGGEDDDMGQRVLQSWSTIDRPLKRFGRYKMLPHVKRRSSVPTVVRRLLRTAGVRRRLDGLNSISFTVAEVSDQQRAYTRYLVDVGRPPESINKLADIQQKQWALTRKLRRGG